MPLIESQRFYCLGCSQLLPVEQAGALFRTGYYLLEHHLGLCAACCRLNFVKKAGWKPEDWYNKAENQ